MSPPMKDAPSSETKMIVLKSSDELLFKVEETVARLSRIIRYMIDDGLGNDVIPLPNIPSPILKKVLQYCEHHATPGKTDMVEFDKMFVEDLKDDGYMLFGVISAANFLDIEGLLEHTCKAVAESLKENNVDEIRRKFNIKKDLTKEEEDEICKDF